MFFDPHTPDIEPLLYQFIQPLGRIIFAYSGNEAGDLIGLPETPPDRRIQRIPPDQILERLSIRQEDELALEEADKNYAWRRSHHGVGEGKVVCIAIRK
jgi:hypothetical protein